MSEVERAVAAELRRAFPDVPVVSGFEREHPFTTPAGSDASMFIQWKGTDVCLDFYCSSGVHGHLDSDFAYFVKCPACDAVYEMGTQVIAKRVDAADADGRELVLEVD